MSSKNTSEKIRFLRNPTSKKILKSCSEKAKPIKEISKSEGIPLAKCYRFATILEEKGYIGVANKVLTEGKEVCMYKTMVDLEFISYSNGKREIKVDLDKRKAENHRPLS